MATRTMLATVWLLALLFLTTAASAQTWQGATYNAIVTRVVDGDTVEVRLGDRVEIVRYTGIHTPEIHHPTRGREPYRDAARAANQQLVEGRTVPGHGAQDLSKKHTGMIVRQLALAGFSREELRSDWRH